MHLQSRKFGQSMGLTRCLICWCNWPQSFWLKEFPKNECNFQHWWSHPSIVGPSWKRQGWYLSYRSNLGLKRKKELLCWKWWVFAWIIEGCRCCKMLSYRKDTLYINNYLLAVPDCSLFCIWTAKVGTTPLTAYWASSTFGLMSVQKNPLFLVLNREKTFDIIIAEISEINNIQRVW